MAKIITCVAIAYTKFKPFTMTSQSHHQSVKQGDTGNTNFGKKLKRGSAMKGLQIYTKLHKDICNIICTHNIGTRTTLTKVRELIAS